jgi:hypothetical protein
LAHTAEYARKLFHLFSPLAPDDEIEAAVASRQERQSFLADPARRFEVIVTENALRLPVVSPLAMRAQMDKLIEVAQMATVSLRVMPSDILPPLLSWNAWVALDDQAVIVELVAGELVYVEHTEIEAYRLAFKMFADCCLSEEDGLYVLSRLWHEMS